MLARLNYNQNKSKLKTMRSSKYTKNFFVIVLLKYLLKYDQKTPVADSKFESVLKLTCLK